MTFTNAKRRFHALGFNLERSTLLARYKFQPFRGGHWRHGDCLESLLMAATKERYPRQSDALSPGELLLTALQQTG